MIPASWARWLRWRRRHARAGHDVTASYCDLSDEDGIERVVDDVVRRFGGIDGLVNNAVSTVDRIDPLDVPRDVWEESFRVNVRAPYVLIARSVPHMIARGGGSIINVTSLAAGTTGKGAGAHAGLLQYGVSKAALNRLTSYFAAELEEDNIAVNAISPGDASAYMRVVNDLGPEVPEQDVVAGTQLDDRFLGQSDRLPRRCPAFRPDRAGLAHLHLRAVLGAAPCHPSRVVTGDP